MPRLSFDNKEDEEIMLRLFEMVRQVEAYRLFCILSGEYFQSQELRS